MVVRRSPNIDAPASDLRTRLPDDKKRPPKPEVIEEKNESDGVEQVQRSHLDPKIPCIDFY